MGRSKWIMLAIGALAIVGVVIAVSSGGTGGGLVGADEFASLQAEGVRIVDVRTAAEFASGHITGAENVPLSSFATEAEGWDPSEPIALYCATGSRSAEAAQMLTARGFKTVYDLSGGIVAWSGPVSSGEGEVAATPAVAATGAATMYEFYTDW